MRKEIEKLIKESIAVKEGMLKKQSDIIAKIIDTIVCAIRSGNKVILFGNGGSASDSQHMAAEFIGRFKKERRPIPAIALATNISSVTALSNDYGYEASFRRELEALAKKGDVAIGISTSGNASNVEEAVKSAKRMGLVVITMTGDDGGRIAPLADIALKVPSKNTPRIQESHITAGHIICELVEGLLGK